MHHREAKEHVVLITGGARGIGTATAERLVASGARVMISDVLDGEGQALAERLGGQAAYVSLDVTDASQWAAAVKATEQTFGSLTALFNNAGIVEFSNIEACTQADFERVMAINVTGCFLGIQAAAPAMKRAGHGVIVNCSSTAGMQGYAGLAAYVTSKWALRGMTKAAALDLARDQIRVVSLHPGPIETPMTESLPREMAATQPIDRFGVPDEVARMVQFLICEASYSTGSEFVIDGGALVGSLAPVKG